MALLGTFTSQILQAQFPRCSAISKQSISETLLVKRPQYPMFSSVSIPASSSTLRYAPLTWFCCSSEEYNTSSPAKIFIKGLPVSTSEGRLVKAFSEFGQVSRVELPMDKGSGKFLGFAYIWFAEEESAQLAVKEMNGKFFDGRFIYVTIAKPGSSKNWRKRAPYKF